MSAVAAGYVAENACAIGGMQMLCMLMLRVLLSCAVAVAL